MQVPVSCNRLSQFLSVTVYSYIEKLRKTIAAHDFAVPSSLQVNRHLPLP